MGPRIIDNLWISISFHCVGVRRGTPGAPGYALEQEYYAGARNSALGACAGVRRVRRGTPGYSPGAYSKTTKKPVSQFFSAIVSKHILIFKKKLPRKKPRTIRTLLGTEKGQLLNNSAQILTNTAKVNETSHVIDWQPKLALKLRRVHCNL